MEEINTSGSLQERMQSALIQDDNDIWGWLVNIIDQSVGMESNEEIYVPSHGITPQVGEHYIQFYIIVILVYMLTLSLSLSIPPLKKKDGRDL